MVRFTNNDITLQIIIIGYNEERSLKVNFASPWRQSTVCNPRCMGHWQACWSIEDRPTVNHSKWSRITTRIVVSLRNGSVG